MSVELKLTGSCKKCEYIDLELDYFRAETYSKGSRKIYSLKCRHEPTCYHMQREHEEAMKDIDKALSELCSE